jgi:hypothetical protein
MIHKFALKFGWCDLEAFVFDEFFDSVGDEEVVI